MTNACINIDNNSGEINVVCSGALDLTNAGELREGLEQVAPSATEVAVDFRGVSFIDSAILEYLARAGRTMMNREKRLKVLVAANSHPSRVLKMSGFDCLMDIDIEPKT